MAYLTQIDLSCETVAKLKLRDTYAWHRAVWEAFPGRDREKRDYLTRLDRRRGGYRLFIVSPEQPSRPAWCPPECWKTTPIPETYLGHRRYRFQLCANPTRKVDKQKDGTVTKNGRRVPLHTREELVAWINRKAEHGGFAVDESTLRTFVRGREYFVKEDWNHAKIVGLHSAVEFQGMLSVSDPVKFREVFARGIGSAKAFGFGLLVIEPL